MEYAVTHSVTLNQRCYGEAAEMTRANALTPLPSFSGLPRESSEPCRHAKRDTKTAMTRANNALEFNNWIPAFGEDDNVEGGEDDGLGGRRTRTPSLTYLM